VIDIEQAKDMRKQKDVAISENVANSRVAKIEEKTESWKTTLCLYQTGKRHR